MSLKNLAHHPYFLTVVRMEEPFSATLLANFLNIQIQLSKSMIFTFFVHLAKPF